MFYIIIIAAGAFQPLLLLKGEKDDNTDDFRTGRNSITFICDLYVLWIETDDFAGCFNHSGKE